MRTRPSRAGAWVVAAVLGCVFSTAATHAQPSENCTGADLDGSDPVPFNQTFTPTTEDFTISDVSCNPLRGTEPVTTPDFVACGRPQFDCEINLQCARTDGGTVWAHIRSLGPGGVCTTAGGQCAGPGALSGIGLATISGTPLIAGQTYCFICSFSASAAGSISIGPTSPVTDPCGALPVELMLFEVTG